MGLRSVQLQIPHVVLLLYVLPLLGTTQRPGRRGSGSGRGKEEEGDAGRPEEAEAGTAGPELTGSI